MALPSTTAYCEEGWVNPFRREISRVMFGCFYDGAARTMREICGDGYAEDLRASQDQCAYFCENVPAKILCHSHYPSAWAEHLDCMILGEVIGGQDVVRSPSMKYLLAPPYLRLHPKAVAQPHRFGINSANTVGKYFGELCRACRPIAITLPRSSTWAWAVLERFEEKKLAAHIDGHRWTFG